MIVVCSVVILNILRYSNVMHLVGLSVDCVLAYPALLLPQISWIQDFVQKKGGVVVNTKVGVAVIGANKNLYYI